MANQQKKETNKNYGIKILCIAVAVLFLTFTIYEAVQLFSAASETFNGIANVLSSVLVLIFGLAGTAVGILGFFQIDRGILILILCLLAIVFILVTIAITVNYIVNEFDFRDVVTLAVNLAMAVGVVMFLIKKKIGKLFLIIPVSTMVLHLYNMVFVYPVYTVSTTSYYILSIFMIGFAVLVGLYLILDKKILLLIGMGVFAFSNMFRMLMLLSNNSSASAMTTLSSFVYFFGDVMFIMCVAFLIITSSKQSSKV